MNRLRIIFAGAGEFGLPTLRTLRESHDIVHVFSQPDRPAGRGRKLTPTPVSQFAIEHNLTLTRTESINRETLEPADVLVVIAFGQKISDTVVYHAKYGSVNLHASLLPRYRGAAPIHAAMLAGDTHTGNSIIRLADKMDAGAILSQSHLQIGELETTGELHDRLALDGAPLVMSTIEALANGTSCEVEQDHSLATHAPKLSRESTRIDWTLSANTIARMILGLYPWPGCRVSLRDPHGTNLDRLTLVRAKVHASSAVGVDVPPVAPGQINSEGFIRAGQGSDEAFVEVVEVQPEGKRPMSLDAYRNGHPWMQGASLESIV